MAPLRASPPFTPAGPGWTNTSLLHGDLVAVGLHFEQFHAYYFDIYIRYQYQSRFATLCATARRSRYARSGEEPRHVPDREVRERVGGSEPKKPRCFASPVTTGQSACARHTRAD